MSELISMPPIPIHERARVVWLAAPALLSALSQFGAVAFFARHGGAERALEFQTMLSLWAWTMVGAFGLDRAARAFAFNQEGLSTYARAWRIRLIGVGLGAGLIGLVVGYWQSEGGAVWAFYGVCVGCGALGLAGREWMLARGEAVAAAQTQSMAFIVAAICMGLMVWAQCPLGWVAVMWFVPHAGVWMIASARMGLFKVHPLTVDDGLRWRARHGAYGLQALGHVALCSLDVVAAKAFLPAQDAFTYVVYSRMAFTAFLASNAFASVFVGRAARAGAKEWIQEFYACAAVHGLFALAAVSVLACAGPWITGVWLGGEGLSLGWVDTGLLGTACAGRALAEAGMQMLSGQKMSGRASGQGASSMAGLILFVLFLGYGVSSPMFALAFAWAAPSLCAFFWLLHKSDDGLPNTPVK